MTPILIYCAGKNRRYDEIALNAGYRLGAQLPSTVYYPIYFADQDWKRPSRAAYMAALEKHRPQMATVLDWEREDQLPEVLSWAEEAAQYVGRILVVPKVQGGIPKIPRKINGSEVVLAYSVPTKFGGSELPLWDFIGWPVHLLGGSPHAQMKIYAHLPGVVSVDGNMHCKMAQRGSFWRIKKGSKGHWVSLFEADGQRWNDGATVRDAPYEAFRRSCENIRQAWEKLP